MENLRRIFDNCEEVIKDIEFKKLREFKDREKKKVLAYFPVYAPCEIFHSLDILPLGLNGAGNEIEILYADARFGSFICSVVKSTMELSLSGRLDFIDGMFFTGICDAARNLSFIFKRSFPEKEMIFLHLPQNPETHSAYDFLIEEYNGLIRKLEGISGEKFSKEKLRESIKIYNKNRRLQRKLYTIRRNTPEILKTSELYAILRMGNYILPEEHNRIMEEVLELLPKRERIERDRIKVLIEGSFCEQPPLELLKLLDETGCHIIEDDFVLGRRLLIDDVNESAEPIGSLAEAYLAKSTYTSVRYSGEKSKPKYFVEKVKEYNPEAVIFMYAKFCEPGLFDYVLFKKELEQENIPYLFIEFEEKMWNFDRVQLEIETFFESLIFA